MRNLNWQKETENDIQECRALGWKVKRFSDIHFRIIEPEFGLSIDVWPSTAKWWGVDSGKRSGTYLDLIHTATKYFEECKSDEQNKIYWEGKQLKK
jgi:hypothetical protein